jgi:hypothetical protein
MHDVMRKRILRKLETLPEAQLYQVLDFIEFVESKYAARAEIEPSALQRFAERLEDRMRARSLAPSAMVGTMKILGTAGRVLDGLTETGRELLKEPPPPRPRAATPKPPVAGPTPRPVRPEPPPPPPDQDTPLTGEPEPPAEEGPAGPANVRVE